MSSESRVEVDNVVKRFATNSRRHRSLKDHIRSVGASTPRSFVALDHVSLRIESGECVGLLGRNGSGKSTLLKCISGIMPPTSGRVVTRGRVVPLLELGAGFQPDLSGRDNINLNAQILGLTRSQVRSKFDSIVEFSELAPFLDTPLRHYSSGMYARLGFAVAIHLEPRVALFDEVMAVGDEAFRHKCHAAVQEMRDQGTTIVLVTHSSEDVLNTCTRVVVLDRGQIIEDAEPTSGVAAYKRVLATRSSVS